MSQKQLSSIQEARNKVYNARNIAADAAEKFDEAFLAWSLVWDKYLTLEKKPNKTESQIAEIFRIYEEMCLAWKTYENENIASKEACSAAFNASVDLHSYMQREILN